VGADLRERLASVWSEVEYVRARSFEGKHVLRTAEPVDTQGRRNPHVLAPVTPAELDTVLACLR
jgi:hypothetical protein